MTAVGDARKRQAEEHAPVALLRTAAERLREAAEAAAWESPWQLSLHDATQVWDQGQRLVASVEGLAETRYIALVDPVVGAALADLLDAAMEHVASFDCMAHCEPQGCATTNAALALARSILGETGGE